MPVDTETDFDEVAAWRLLELLRAGWEQHRAELIAKRTDIDLHRAVDLLKAGCNQRLALKILL